MAWGVADLGKGVTPSPCHAMRRCRPQSSRGAEDHEAASSQGRWLAGHAGSPAGPGRPRSRADAPFLKQRLPRRVSAKRCKRRKLTSCQSEDPPKSTSP